MLFSKILKEVSKYTNITLASSLLIILLVLIFPIPKGFLDFFLSISISVSIIILMSSLFILKPLELSVFPTILLISTLLRLSLNIASTRLILSHGHLGSDSAGRIIEAFGNFIMQGNVVIGLIVFLILTLINFIVITKGSGRIAEVAARFSLDAMPGKQMSIDSDLNNGLLTEEEAKKKRTNLENETSFYGSMDGANKFVRGDAIAGLVITFINLVGGMIVGIVQKNLSFNIAVKTYSLLTIGDGLVSQIPSLIISLSAGLLVTKAGVVGATDKLLFQQLGKYPETLLVTSIVVFIMGFLPGLPFFVFSLTSAVILFIWYISLFFKKDKNTSNALHEKSNSNDKSSNFVSQEQKYSDILALDYISLEIGLELIDMIKNPNINFKFIIEELRKELAQEYGFVFPPIRIVDNITLGYDHYVIKIKGLQIAKGFIRRDKYLVFNPLGKEVNVIGEDFKDNAFGFNAKWVDIRYTDEIIKNNYTLVKSHFVIITHIKEVIKENIVDFLSYGVVDQLIKNIPQEHKALANYVVPEIASIATIQKILQNLLKELISIRDFATILEAIGEVAKNNQDITSITEYVRFKLSRQISYSHTNSDGYISSIILSDSWENTFLNSISHTDETLKRPNFIMKPSQMQQFIQRVNLIFSKYLKEGSDTPVLLSNPKIRPYVKDILAPLLPNIFVMSENEIYQKTKIKTLDLI